MSAILDLISREQAKLVRRRENVAATKLEIEVLGSTPKLEAKLGRQEAAVKQSQAVIAKLNKHAGTLEAKTAK